ncbi:MAG: phosphatidate cytidylyltransferase [Alistipes sp.]
MNEKMKNLTLRTLSGLVLAAVVIGAILLSKWSFGALLLAILIGGMCEFYRMTGKSGVSPQRILGLVLGVLFFVVNFLQATEVLDVAETVKMMTLYCILLIPVMFICELYRHHENPIANIGTTLLGVLYIALPLSLMCYFPHIQGGWNPSVMLFFIFIIWSNDVFAYLVGMSIGKHKLFKRLSPKKSWEGFFGGVAGAVAMGVVAANVMGANPYHWIVLALVASVSGVLGDLVESMFKRSINVKDSGKSIPGHGGWLDRFDAMLLSAPFVFVYMILIEMI